MHTFPSSLSRIKVWLRSIEKNNHQYFGNIDALAKNIFCKKNNSPFRICSDHFLSECYAPGHSKRRALRPDAIPTRFCVPLTLTSFHDSPPPQQSPFMVDAITQTDPYTNTEDKGAQWPEFEFNVGGPAWKIKHDHGYHTSTASSYVSTEDNPMIYGLQQSTQPKQLGVPKSARCPALTEGHTPHSSVYSDSSCQESADENCVKERKFIVFESCLDVLFANVRCKIEHCYSPVVHTQKHVLGSYLSVTGQCRKGHLFHVWHSQPTRGEAALGNVLSSAAVLFSGSNFSKVQDMCELLGLQFISRSLYDLYQRKYLFPTVNVHWQQDRLRLNVASLGTQLCLVGNGKCSTYEDGSKYGIYTFLDVATKRIVDFETIQGTKENSSAALKRKAFVKCLKRILQNRFEVKSVVTDYQPKIRKTCEQYYRIHHKYDVWQYTESLEKRLQAASKKENCSVIAEWIPSIKKHLWWCCTTSKRNGEVLRELWQSLLMHVTDQHEWDHGEMCHACAHRPLTKLERRCQPWMKENSQPYLALYDVVMNPTVLKDLDHLSQFLHAGELEVYHHFVSKYRPKKVHLKIDALEARLKLAALAHNANVPRQCAKAKSIWHRKAAIGTHSVVSTQKKTCGLKKLQGPSTNSHLLPLMTDVLKFFDCRLTNDLSLWTWVKIKHSGTSTNKSLVYHTEFIEFKK
ncbi:uncharacterized protein LOC122935330 [Bufo gargarizans]|uniref:uncharacterized protein LOC122935330 n=1 Tax=Bufo gargarizans TaxID=30331 RepID=UPI001CF1F349|nr:uncharacterized protein LOC122935330 [Bufo gargarizans]